VIGPKKQVVKFRASVPLTAALDTVDDDILLGRCGVVGRWGVVGSTLAFGSIGHGFESDTAYFHIMVHQPSAS